MKKQNMRLYFNSPEFKEISALGVKYEKELRLLDKNIEDFIDFVLTHIQDESPRTDLEPASEFVSYKVHLSPELPAHIRIELVEILQKYKKTWLL